MAYTDLGRLDSIKKSILKTFIYEDIFDFPLTYDEAWKFLICNKKIQESTFEKELQNLTGKFILKKDGYYSLIGREKIIKERKKNLEEVRKKQQIAKRGARFLSIIPTVLFIGISGGLAIGDAREDDDIDFFIITKKQTLFTTRFFILLILEVMGLRRRRTAEKAADKICVNYLIDETNLSTPQKRRDIYTAHEIVQLKLLFERDAMYSKFLKSNNWINKFLPNITISEPIRKTKAHGTLSNLFSPLEAFLRSIQIAFMKRHMGRETVEQNELMFHPDDYRVRTIKKMSSKLRELGLLTKN